MPESRKKKQSKKGGCPYGAGTTGAARHRKRVAKSTMEPKRKSRSKSHSKKSRSKKSKSRSKH